MLLFAAISSTTPHCSPRKFSELIRLLRICRHRKPGPGWPKLVSRLLARQRWTVLGKIRPIYGNDKIWCQNVSSRCSDVTGGEKLTSTVDSLLLCRQRAGQLCNAKESAILSTPLSEISSNSSAKKSKPKQLARSRSIDIYIIYIHIYIYIL